MSNLITQEMKINTARNIYTEILALKTCLLSAYKNSLFTPEEVMEKMGYVIQCCIHEIMSTLDIEDDFEGVNYNTISDCIEDDDSFEYMMKALGFIEPKDEK